MFQSKADTIILSVTREIMVRPCLSSRYAAEDYATRTVDGSRRRGRPRKSWKDDIEEWTGQSMSSLLHMMDDRGRSVIATDASVAQKTTPQRHGY